MSSPEIVRLLLDHGADASLVSDTGANAFVIACENPAMDTASFDALFYSGGMRMHQQVIPRTRKWRAICRLFESAVQRGLFTSAFALDIAHHRKATALHKAAQSGNVRYEVRLLASGASQSLLTRNAMGCTPLDVAKEFGPFIEVEAVLVEAMLRKAFDAHYTIFDGRLLRKEQKRRISSGVRSYLSSSIDP